MEKFIGGEKPDAAQEGLPPKWAFGLQGRFMLRPIEPKKNLCDSVSKERMC